MFAPSCAAAVDGGLRVTPFNRYLGDGVKRHLSTNISDDCVVGTRTKIGAKTVIHKSVLGKNCIIGDNCRIENCILWDGCVVGDGC